MATLDEVLAETLNLIQYYAAPRDQLEDWIAGPVDGGPAGDGFYPISRIDGSTFFAPSPAKVAQFASSATINGDVSLIYLVEDRVYASAAAAIADTTEAAGVWSLVVGDANRDLDGWYQKVGAPGAGANVLRVNLYTTQAEFDAIFTPALAEIAAQLVEAQAYAVAAASSAGVLSPLLNTPAPDAAQSHLLELNLFEEINGVAIPWPANLQLRELKVDPLFRMRIAIGGGDVLDGDGAYPKIAGAAFDGTFEVAAGTTSGTLFNLYATTGALGFSSGTVVGTYRVKSPATPFGAPPYAATVFPFADGALKRDRVLPSAVERSNYARAGRAATLPFIGSPFLSTVTDPYLLALVEDVEIERGVPGRGYVFNYRSDTAGALRRLVFDLYDPVLGVIVASGGRQENYDWSGVAQPVMALMNTSFGTPYANYTGISVTVRLNVAALNFNKGATAHTTTALAGVKPSRVYSREVVRHNLRYGKARNQLTVGPPPCTHLTIQAAVESLMKDPMAPRSAYPFSDLCTPSNQYEIVVVAPNHVEERVERVIDHGGGLMIGVGIILWSGLTIRLRHDTRIWSNGSLAYGAPVFEMNHGGRIVGPITAVIENTGYGYAIHMDGGNTMSKSATIGEAEQYYQLVATIDGCTLKGSDANGGSWIIGRGISDDEDIDIRNGAMFRTGVSTVAYLGMHTSPSCVRPGRIHLENMAFNDNAVVGSNGAVQLLKSNAATARHQLSMVNCKAGKIAHGNSGGGNSGFVLLGRADGTIYDAAALDLAA